MSNKRPGAQPGNKNALKHGFYAERFTTAEKERLELQDPTDVEGEIAFLRVCLNRLGEQMNFEIPDPIATIIDAEENLDLATPSEIFDLATQEKAMPARADEHLLKQLNTAANISLAIATLTRTQHIIHGKTGEVTDAIKDAFEQIRLDMGL